LRVAVWINDNALVSISVVIPTIHYTSFPATSP